MAEMLPEVSEKPFWFVAGSEITDYVSDQSSIRIKSLKSFTKEEAF